MLILLAILAGIGNFSSSRAISDPFFHNAAMNHPGSEASLCNHSMDTSEDLIDHSGTSILPVDRITCEKIFSFKFASPVRLAYAIFQPPKTL